MSDNATLVQRLNQWADADHITPPGRRALREAAACIAELEAELAKAHSLAGDLFHRTRDLEIIKAKSEARIAELNRLMGIAEADLEDPTLSVGEAYAYRSESHPAKKPPR